MTIGIACRRDVLVPQHLLHFLQRELPAGEPVGGREVAQCVEVKQRLALGVDKAAGALQWPPVRIIDIAVPLEAAVAIGKQPSRAAPAGTTPAIPAAY